jgi:hypothetical protein
MSEMLQPDYNRVQLNHIRQLYDEAKKEYPRLDHSSFMLLYFRFEGVEAFSRYVKGERHFPTWQQLKGNKELSDLLDASPQLKQPFVYEGGIRE